MALYRTGTAAMDAQGVITGTGTKWKEPLSLIRTGATIVFLTSPLKLAVISDIVSNTEMRAIQTDGEAVNNGQYVILLNDSLTVDGMAQDVAETLRYYQSKETVIEEAIEFLKAFDFDKLKQLADQVKADAASANKAKTDAQSAQKAAETARSQANTIKNDTQKIKDSAVTEITAIKTEALDARDAAEEAQFAAEQNAANANQHKVDAQTAEAEAEKWAKVAQDAAGQAQEPYKNVIQPFPDVWIPFNDSLDMLAGFSPGYKQITVGDDVVNMVSDKVVNFKRASGATYINKSGVLTVAEIDEPRFEKEGLLIEGQRSNALADSNNPSAWNKASTLNITNATDDFNFTYGVVDVVAETSSTGRATFISTGYPRSLPAKAGESLTISCRVKKAAGDGILTVYLRIAYVNDDGSSNTLVSNAYINVETGEVLGTPAGGSSTKVYAKKEDNGWTFVSITYTTTEEKTFYGRMEVGAHQRDIKIGDQWHITTPQFEVGSSASSFIISGSTTTTRAADMASIPVLNNINSYPLSCLVEVNRNWEEIAPNALPRILAIGSGFNAGNYFSFEFSSTTLKPVIRFLNSGSGAVSGVLPSFGKKAILGFVHDGENVYGFTNGEIGTKSTGSTWVGADKKYNIVIGYQDAQGIRNLFGHVRNLRIWHKKLTDVQMSEAV